MNIDGDIIVLKGIVSEHRRFLHRFPELGFDVAYTRDYILSCLKGLNFDHIEVLCNTGIKAVMLADCAKKTLAFRADMDALPIEEETGLCFSSENKGKMHGCGHDGHMAILLGFAKWLHLNKESLRYNIVLIFQPAEETIGGAKPMIEAGALAHPKVDAVFGFHIMPEIPEGRLAVKKGILMAQTCEFDIEFYGKSAHGAMPYLGRDAIAAAAGFISSVQGIVSRYNNDGDALLTIGQIGGGHARNIIADRAIIKGIIRTFSDNIYGKLKIDILNFLENIKSSLGVEFAYKENVYYPAVVNDIGLAQNIIEKLPEGMLHHIEPMMLAEDFSYYQKEVPGVFMLLGSRNESAGVTEPLHSTGFDFNEDILLLAIQVLKLIIT